MHPTGYMDKRITQHSKSIVDVGEGSDDGGDYDNVFGFHPVAPSQPPHLRGWSCMEDRIDSAGGSWGDEALISAIDQKMKEHADVLLHSVECLSARVSQMESRTRRLENVMDDLREVIEFNHGNTGRKLKELENVLLEVHGSVKDIRDKQEIAEAQLRLSSLNVSKTEPQPVKGKTVHTTSINEGSSSIPLQSSQPLAASVPCPQPPLSFCNVSNINPENCPPPSPAAATPTFPMITAAMVAATVPQLPTQSTQNLVPSYPHQQSYYTVPVSTPATANQHYNAPAAQLPQATSLTQQTYTPNLPLSSPLTHIPPAHSPFTISDPQVQYPMSHPTEVPYPPPHSIIKSSQLPGRLLPPVQLNVGYMQQVPSQPSDKHYPESQAQWRQPRGQSSITNSYQHGALLAWDRSPTMKPLQALQSSPRPGGEGGYSRLPTAQVLPHAIPTASSVGAESSSTGTGNRVPVDDVIDKVVAMGFRRDLVRATVKKLTENGQSVDLNMVLDKLMNNG